MKKKDEEFVLVDARGKRQQAEAAATFKVKDFRGHDLRRTAASLMASGGVPRLTISKILSHVERGVTKVYDRHSYDPEKKAALNWWATLGLVSTAPGTALQLFTAIDTVARGNAGEIVFGYTSFDRSPSLYRCDVASRKTELLLPPEARIEGLATRRMWATSKDGTRVPADVIHRRTLDMSQPRSNGAAERLTRVINSGV